MLITKVLIFFRTRFCTTKFAFNHSILFQSFNFLTTMKISKEQNLWSILEHTTATQEIIYDYLASKRSKNIPLKGLSKTMYAVLSMQM